MATQRALILCKSVHHRNTSRVANAIAEVLDAEVAAPEEVPYTSLEGASLVGFGSGVYYGWMHEVLFGWLAGLPDAPEPVTPAFLFSTSGLPWLSWLWHRPLRRLLAVKGFRVVGEFSCGGHDTWGPLWLTGGLNKTHPDEHDLERARKFAGGIQRTLQAAAASPVYAASK